MGIIWSPLGVDKNKTRTGRYYTLPATEKVVGLFKRELIDNGIQLGRITSASRDAYNQGRIMYANWHSLSKNKKKPGDTTSTLLARRKKYLTGLYNTAKATVVDKIFADAYRADNNGNGDISPNSLSDALNDVEKYLDVNKISNHQYGKSIDVESNSKLKAFIKSGKSKWAEKVLDEGNHLHIKFYDNALNNSTPIGKISNKTQVFNKDGFDKRGYDKDGYDKDGYMDPKVIDSTEDWFTNKGEGDAFRLWANSTPELKKKYGTDSKYDLDPPSDKSKHNNSFIKKAYSAAKPDYESHLLNKNNSNSISTFDKYKASLEKRRALQNNSGIKQDDRPHIELGARGEEVEAVQSTLDVEVDGEFGQDTKQAVEDFQTKNKLKVDGVVGPETSNAMRLTSVIAKNNLDKEKAETKSKREELRILKKVAHQDKKQARIDKKIAKQQQKIKDIGESIILDFNSFKRSLNS
jgi:hypothetical protein